MSAPRIDPEEDRRPSWEAQLAFWQSPLQPDCDFAIVLGMPDSTWHMLKKRYDIRPIVLGKRAYHVPAQVAQKLANGRRRGEP